MTTNNHPITPPPELVQQWVDDFAPMGMLTLAIQAARWGADQQLKLDAEQIAQAYQKGADQELEACCDAVYSYEGSPIHGGTAEWLRIARRPKPPTLKEQALEALTKIEDNKATYLDSSVIRRALEALPND